MMDLIKEAGLQMNQLPRPIQLWMQWLNIVFLPSLFFVFSYAEVRWVILVYFIGFPVGFLAYYFTKDLGMMGVAHILFWTPLLCYLAYTLIDNPNVSFLSLYGVWVSLLCLTMAIAVILDIKAVSSFLRGAGNAL